MAKFKKEQLEHLRKHAILDRHAYIDCLTNDHDIKIAKAELKHICDITIDNVTDDDICLLCFCAECFWVAWYESYDKKSYNAHSSDEKYKKEAMRELKKIDRIRSKVMK